MEDLKEQLSKIPSKCEVLFLPLYVESHFKIFIASFKNNSFIALDSLGVNENETNEVFENLQNLNSRFKGLTRANADAVMQHDFHNCGIFVLKYVEDFLSGKSPLAQDFSSGSSKDTLAFYRSDLAASVFKYELSKETDNRYCCFCMSLIYPDGYICAKCQSAKCAAHVTVQCEICEPPQSEPKLNVVITEMFIGCQHESIK